VGLSESTEAAWRAFSEQADWQTLSVPDRERLALFVIEVHRSGDRVERFSDIAIAAGCPEDRAVTLGARFEFALEVLAAYDVRNSERKV
jgi:hypothetical protein